jgi:putative endonuclease
MRGAWLYIMSNRPNGILYVGTTVNLPRRIWEHREGIVDGFIRGFRVKAFSGRTDHISAIAATQGWSRPLSMTT